MLPVVRGKPHTRFQILLYTLVLVPLGVLPALLHIGGALYLAASARHRRSGSCGKPSPPIARRDEAKEPAAHRLFGVSLLYLSALFAALIVEKLAGLPALPWRWIVRDDDAGPRAPQTQYRAGAGARRALPYCFI